MEGGTYFLDWGVYLEEETHQMTAAIACWRGERREEPGGLSSDFRGKVFSVHFVSFFHLFSIADKDGVHGKGDKSEQDF